MKKFRYWKLLAVGMPLLCGTVALTCVGAKKVQEQKIAEKAEKLGMMMQSGNAIHLGKGTYTLKFTKNFADEMFDDVSEEDRQMAIGGILNGVKSFNNISENVKFEVCGETDQLASYGIQKGKGTGKIEIPVYISETQKSQEVAEVNLLADNGGKVRDADLTYVKHYMFAVWKDFGPENLDKTLAPENTVVSTSTQHELDHILGFADDYSKDRKYTIMRYYINENTKNYTNLDEYKIAYANYLFADGKKPDVNEYLDKADQEHLFKDETL